MSFPKYQCLDSALVFGPPGTLVRHEDTSERIALESCLDARDDGLVRTRKGRMP